MTTRTSISLVSVVLLAACGHSESATTGSTSHSDPPGRVPAADTGSDVADTVDSGQLANGDEPSRRDAAPSLPPAIMVDGAAPGDEGTGANPNASCAPITPQDIAAIETEFWPAKVHGCEDGPIEVLSGYLDRGSECTPETNGAAQ